jgi:predicted GNAT family acetyltransferase
MPTGPIVKAGKKAVKSAYQKAVDKGLDMSKARVSTQIARGEIKSIVDSLNDQGIKTSVSVSDDIITINKIIVPKEARGAGLGTDAIQQIISYADSSGRKVALTPSTDFGGNMAGLKRLYKRLGFVENKGSNKEFEISESMYRPINVAFNPDQTSGPNLLSGNALDMSQKARLARAKEQGFDVDNVYYHGTNKDIEAFDDSLFQKFDAGDYGAGVYLTESPASASAYAEWRTRGKRGGEANVLPVNVKSGNFYTIYKDSNLPDAQQKFPPIDDKEYSKYFSDELKKQGYDGVKVIMRDVDDETGEIVGEFIQELVVFDPKNIRSVNAAFDPAAKDSSKLLAGTVAGTVGVGAMQGNEAQAAEFTPEQQAVLERVRARREATQTQAQAQFTPEQQAAIARAKERRAKKDSFLKNTGDVLTEAAAAINRGAVDILEFVPLTVLNTLAEGVAKVKGTEPKRFRTEDLPFVGGFIEQAQQGGQMVPGMPRDIVQRGGEYIPMAMTGAAALRGAASMLPAQTAGESASMGVLRQMAPTTAGLEVGGAVGAGAGEVVGKEVGGETGEMIGGVAGGLTGAGIGAGISSTARKAVDALATRIGVTVDDLIDIQTGVPTTSLQRALKKHNVKFATLLDDPADDISVTLSPPDIKALPAPQREARMSEYVRRAVVKKLKEGSRSEALADKKLNPNQTDYVKDQIGALAVKQGFRPGDVTHAKTANSVTRKAMASMLDIERRILDNTGYAQIELPLDVAGNEAFKRWKLIRSHVNDLGGQLDNIVNRPAHDARAITQGTGAPGGLRGAAIDTRGVERAVLDGLKAFEIDVPQSVINDTTQLKAFINDNLAFKGSAISKNESSIKVVRDVIDILSDAKQADARFAHIAKRQLDEMIDYKRKSSELTPSGERFAKSLREALNNSIRDVSPEYARINDELHDGLTAINMFVDSMPTKIDLYAEGALKAMGQQMRKIETNYSNKQALDNALTALDDTARRFGGEYDVNMRDLVTFSNTLNDRFGASVRGGFQGVQEQAGRNVARAFLSPKEAALEKVTEKITEALSPDDEKALNAMQILLRREQ